MPNPFVSTKQESRNPFVRQLNIEESVGQLGDASQFIPPVPDVGEGNTFANSQEFKDLISRAAQDPENLTDAEKKQVKAGRENFPVIDQFMKSSESRPDPEKDKLFDGLDRLAQGASAPEGFGSGPAASYRRAIHELRGLIQAAKEKSRERKPSGIERAATPLGNINLSKEISSFFDDFGLGPLGETRTERQKVDGVTKEVTVPVPVPMRVATNLIIGAARFLPELAAGFIDNPAEFALGLAEFPIEEVDVILQASSGRDLEGKILTEKDVEQAKEEIINNPVGIALLGLMAFGVAKKGFGKSSGKITVEKSMIEEISKERDSFSKDLEIANKKLEKVNELEASRSKKVEKPLTDIQEKIIRAEEDVTRLQRINDRLNKEGGTPDQIRITAEQLEKAKLDEAKQKAVPETVEKPSDVPPVEVPAESKPSGAKATPEQVAIADAVTKDKTNPFTIKADAAEFPPGAEQFTVTAGAGKEFSINFKKGEATPAAIVDKLNKKIEPSGGVKGKSELTTETVEQKGIESGFIEEPIKELSAGVPVETLKKKKSPLTIRAEERFLDITRERKARIYEADVRTRNWKKRYSEVDRENAGAIVEGIENLRTGEKPKLTPELKTLVDEYKAAQEKSRTDINEYLRNTAEGDYIEFLEDYLPHFYVGKVEKVTGSAWLKNSPNAKARKLPTLKEAVDLGLKPISQDVAFLHKMWADINWKVAANRQTIQLFKDMKSPDGGPAVVTGDKPGADWKHFDHPAIARLYASKGKDGKTLLWRGGVWVHPDLVQVAKMAFDNPLKNRGFVGRAYDVTSAFAKTISLSLSGFHPLALFESGQAVLAKGKNPIRGLFIFGKEARVVAGNPVEVTFRAGKKFQERNPGKVADFIRDGLDFGSSKADVGFNIVQKSLRSLEAKTSQIPIAKWMTRKLRQGFDLNNKLLWEQIHEGYKVYAHETILADILPKLPENISSKGTKAVRESVARSLNDAFGGQEWEAKFWLSPTGLMYARRIALAPDWTFSNLAIAFRSATVPKNAATKNLTLKYWRNMAGTVIGATQALNYWSTGHSTIENEKGHKLDINITAARKAIDESLSKIIPGYKFDPNDKQQYYVRIAKQAREIMSWFDDPLKIASNKMNPVAREIFKQVTGAQPGSGFQSDWTREDIAFYESIPLRLKSAADIFTPFSFSNNNFAFALPMSKGMTPFKAIRFYQEALDSKSWLVDGKPAKMQDTIDEITKGALLNGLDPKRLYVAARSAVRGKYYKAYFDALENEDFDKLNEIGSILSRLGATDKTIAASAKRRGIK